MSTNSTPLSSSSIAAKAYNIASNALYRHTGKAEFASFQEGMRGIDTIRNTIYMPEFESHGYSFVTRPKLNLTTTSIRQDRIMSLLDSLDPQTVPFAIRALLDTNLINEYKIDTNTSQFFNKLNPFIPMLTNRLVSLSGFPDPTIDIETTEGGFFSESITYPKGHDQLTKNYDLSATYNDTHGSPIMILFMIWTRYLHLITRGVMSQYMEDIEARRMGFTSSIYRFVMDPSNRYITKWGKATGCFPRSIPLGAYFNYDANASAIETSMNMSVPFTVAGRIEYLDPIILREFNMLMERRCYNIKQWETAHDEKRMALNFRCIPYIDLDSGSNELMWKYDPNDEENKRVLNELSDMGDSISKLKPIPAGDVYDELGILTI